MNKTHREEMFGPTYSDGQFLYCMQCERTYPAGKHRTMIDDDPLPEMHGFEIMQMCPYSDCDGDAVINATEWETVRDHHPDYPETPEEGRVYPLN